MKIVYTETATYYECVLKASHRSKSETEIEKNFVWRANIKSVATDLSFVTQKTNKFVINCRHMHWWYAQLIKINNDLFYPFK